MIVNNMLYCTNMNINQIMPYNTYNSIQRSIPFQFQNIFHKKKDFKKYNFNTQQINNDNYLINKKEEKIYKNKMEKHRRGSLDTTVSSHSSNSNEEKENENNNIEHTEILVKPIYPILNNIQKRSLINEEIKNLYKEKENIQIDRKNSEGNEVYSGNPFLENTEILRVNVRLSKDKIAIFKLKRYDDIFETIKLFCEINLVNEKLIKPIIIKSLATLNTIYQIMNSKLNNEQINILNKIQSN